MNSLSKLAREATDKAWIEQTKALNAEQRILPSVFDQLPYLEAASSEKESEVRKALIAMRRDHPARPEAAETFVFGKEGYEGDADTCPDAPKAKRQRAATAASAITLRSLTTEFITI